MSRLPRMQAPGDIHHVMSHGIDSLSLFETDNDCKYFIKLLETNLRRYNCRCYGFVLMRNHYHLILRPDGESLSGLMQVVNNCFARYINRTRGRRGYVFYDRFKSIPTRNLQYVKNLIYYLHANPLRAGRVKSISGLSSYFWSSHHCLTSTLNPFPWVQADYMKAVISHGQAFSGAQYFGELSQYTTSHFNPWEIEFHRKEIELENSSKIFIREAQWVRDTIRRWEQRKLLRLKLQQQPDFLEELLRYCKHRFGLADSDFVFSHRTRDVCRVIKLFSHWAIAVAGYSATLVGSLVNRTNSSVLRAARLGECMVQNEVIPEFS